MQFVRKQGDSLVIANLFNEQHAAQLISLAKLTSSKLVFRNVGVKVTRLILNYYEEAPIEQVVIEYNWNTIMTTPQLVCYDKNQWKTLQQLNNWNREWSELFTTCYALTKLTLKVQCSWMDQQFARLLLQGVARIPNISNVEVSFASKRGIVQEVLSAFEKAKIFKQFKQQFTQLQ